MKKYVKPNLEIIKLEVEDVLTNSGIFNSKKFCELAPEGCEEN